MRFLLPILAFVFATSCVHPSKKSPTIAVGKLTAAVTSVSFSGLDGKGRVTIVGKIMLRIQAPAELAGTQLRIWINDETPMKAGDTVDFDFTGCEVSKEEDGVLGVPMLSSFPYKIRPNQAPEPTRGAGPFCCSISLAACGSA